MDLALLLLVFSPIYYLNKSSRTFVSSLNLLHAFYSEGLVDNRAFLAWLVQQMSSCNLAQAGFVARLADEYLDGMLVSRALTYPFVVGCLHKLSEVVIFTFN